MLLPFFDVLTFSALQGPQIRSLVHSGYAQYMSDIDHAINFLSFFYPNLPMPSFRKRNLARKKVGEMIASKCLPFNYRLILQTY